MFLIQSSLIAAQYLLSLGVWGVLAKFDIFYPFPNDDEENVLIKIGIYSNIMWGKSAKYMKTFSLREEKVLNRLELFPRRKMLNRKINMPPWLSVLDVIHEIHELQNNEVS